MLDFFEEFWALFQPKAFNSKSGPMCRSSSLYILTSYVNTKMVVKILFDINVHLLLCYRAAVF